MLRAIHTPGHAPNHLCFLLEGERLLFSGDHVMDGSTVVISPPDGDMAVYLESLERVPHPSTPPPHHRPGHGHLIEDPIQRIEGYLSHRAEREQQVLAKVRSDGPLTIPRSWPTSTPTCARSSTRWPPRAVWAHLRKLHDEKLVQGDRESADGPGRSAGLISVVAGVSASASSASRAATGRVEHAGASSRPARPGDRLGEDAVRRSRRNASAAGPSPSATGTPMSPPRGHARLERHLAEERHAGLVGQGAGRRPRRTARTCVAVLAGEGAHVLDHAGDAEEALAGHRRRRARPPSARRVRRVVTTMTSARGTQLGHAHLHVAGAGRHVDEAGSRGRRPTRRPGGSA